MKNFNIKIYGTDWCSDCIRAKSFLDSNKINYEWFNIELDERLLNYVLEINNGKRIVPTIIFEDGSILLEPTNKQLAEKIGLN
ncbi:MAG: glutaredoxin domain-containing protein [Dehalococcoidia bacterium]|jgi:glutaredoxin-like protein|nr:NrdH-redoxin [Chloroflexota bacterium]|tara:strand:+ start:514 stop:762 length:249 start_codon:yes stop_codon:yes gene_type:complete